MRNRSHGLTRPLAFALLTLAGDILGGFRRGDTRCATRLQRTVLNGGSLWRLWWILFAVSGLPPLTVEKHNEEGADKCCAPIKEEEEVQKRRSIACELVR